MVRQPVPAGRRKTAAATTKNALGFLVSLCTDRCPGKIVNSTLPAKAFPKTLSAFVHISSKEAISNAVMSMSW
jgi:hypothetical protein